MGRGTAWSDTETYFLWENRFMDEITLSEKLGRSLSAVRNAKYKLLNSPPPRPARNGPTEPKWKCVPWTDEARQYVADHPDGVARSIADVLGRSVQSIRNERLRQRREAGVPAEHPKADVPHQELWDCPPGMYEKVVGRLLIEDEEVMGHWMHAHGYSSFEIRDEDPKGWTTIICWKVT